MTGPPLLLGHGIVGTFHAWDPDLELNPQYARIAHLLPIEPVGMLLEHPDQRDPPKRCASAITFDLPAVREAGVFANRPRWELHCLDPLHVEPSILCTPEKGGCGWHGWIRDGLWVPA